MLPRKYILGLFLFILFCLYNLRGDEVDSGQSLSQPDFYHQTLDPLCVPQQSTKKPEIILKFDPMPLDIDRADLVQLRQYCEPYVYTRLFMGIGIKEDEECSIASPKRGKHCTWYHMCIWPPEIDIYVSKAIYDGLMWEPELMNLARIQIANKPKGIFLDVGANIGQYTLLAAALGHVVFAFEPIPEHVDMIQRSLKLNGFQDTVYVYRNAISDYHAQVHINVHKTNKGGSTIEKINSLEDEVVTDDRFFAKVPIELITLDDILPIIDREHPDLDIVFWKADIEGYEPRMFRGAPKFFAAKKPPYIIFELLGKSFERTQCHLSELLPGLAKLGYKMYDYTREGTIVEWTPERMKSLPGDYPTPASIRTLHDNVIMERIPPQEDTHQP